MVQAKDIPDDAIVELVAEIAAANGGNWVMTWELNERLPSFPPKVILTKCRTLIRRGLLDGCACGCRGDFRLPDEPKETTT